MKINKIKLNECANANGLVVVIDVIRAFTTAAYAFAGGAEKIILAGPIEEAFDLHKRFPDALLMGELNGIPIPGFHFGNSPVQVANGSLKGKTLIQRTSSGTQGVVRSTNASRILISSFAVAEASFRNIMLSKYPEVTFVITGQSYGGEEDLALADYLEHKIIHGHADASPFLERVKQSPTGKRFTEVGPKAHFPIHDLDAACKLDQFPFAMEVFKEDGLLVARTIT